MLKTRECKKCNNIMRLGFIDYDTIIYNRDVVIEDIEGYQCPNCGYKEPGEGMRKYLEDRILDKRLELLGTLEIMPIYISNVKEIREKKGLSQRQVADALGVAEQRFSAIERNVNTPTILITYALAHFFGVSSDDLYELIYIPNDFYYTLLNLELVRTNDEVKFNYIKEAEEVRNKLDNIRKEIDDLNMDLRQYRLKLRKGEIEEDEGKKRIKVIDNKKKEELRPVKEKLEKELSKIEKKYNLIVKQNHIIAREDWVEVEKQYSEELEKALGKRYKK